MAHRTIATCIAEGARGRGNDHGRPVPGTARARRAPLAAIGAVVLLATLAAVALLAAHAAADRVPHAPIVISGDAGFTPANGVVSGSGTAGDPYVIEEYTISVLSETGVYIEDTTKHYVLRNVTVLGVGSRSNAGVHLVNSTNGVLGGIVVNATSLGIRAEASSSLVIDNCTVSNGEIGVLLDTCFGVVVRNVAARGFTDGFRLVACDSCDADRCTSTGNGQNGFDLVQSSTAQTERCRLMGCNASLNRMGFVLSDTWSCEVTGCVARDNSANDVNLYDADRTVLDRCGLGKGALYVDGYFENQDVRGTNTVDGRPLRYLKYASDLTLDSDVGQVFLVRCDNVTVANLTFDGIAVPVTLYSSKGCSLVNCTIAGAMYAIMAEEKGPIDVVGCHVGRGTGGFRTIVGVYLEGCDANVTDTDVTGAASGIVALGSDTVRVTNCTVGRISGPGIYANPSTGAPYVGGTLEVEGGSLLDSQYGITSSYWTIDIHGVRVDNMTVAGIHMEDEAGSVVDGCNLTRCPVAIRTYSCRQLLVSSNVVAGVQGSFGIRLEHTSGTVQDTDVTGCVPAIYLFMSADSTLLRNSVTGGDQTLNQQGILIANSPRVAVSGCEASGFGIGIRLVASGNCEVTRCLLDNCTYGIEVLTSTGASVRESTLRGCVRLGVRVSMSSAFEAHHNNFLRCNYDAVSGTYKGRQAWDDSTGSYWDDGGAEGNYWGDYTQWYPDATPDGRVWDTPYDLDGTGGMADMYPLTLLYDFRPPVAAAGDDVTVGENTTVTLDGSRSTDDIGISGYVWRFTYGGQPVSLDGAVVQYTFGPLGTYEVILTVRDAWGNTGSDKVVVRVVDMVPPVAVAGEDVTVNVDEMFVLDGSASFDDHGVVSYLWTVDPAGLNITSRTPLLVLSMHDVGDFPAVLEVWDEAGNSANGSLVVHVRDLTPPSAMAGPDIDIGQGEVASFNASGSTDNVGIVRWNWTFVYNGTEVTLSGEDASYAFYVPGAYSVILTVWDAGGGWSQDSLWVRVRDTEPPVADAGPDLWVDQHEVVALDAAGSHDNVGIVTYVWHVTIDGEDRSFVGESVDVVFLKAGDYPVQLNVTDGAGNWGRDSMVVHVADVTPPVAAAGPDVTVNQHTEVEFDGRSSTDDVGVVSYSWALDDGGTTFTYDTPTGAHTFDAVGVYNVTLTVADAAGNAASDSFTVTVRDIEPPVAVSGGNRTVVEGATVVLDASASHDNVGIALYRWAVVTPNGTVYHSGAVYSFKAEGTGDLKVELRVEDAAGNAAIDDLIVTVLPLYVTLRLGPFADQDGKAVEGASVTVTLNGTVYTGTTDRLGYANLLVDRFDLVTPLSLVADKPGFQRLSAELPLDSQGRPTEDVPAMGRVPESGLENPLLLVMLVAIIGIVLGGVAYAIYRTSRGKGEGPGE